MKRYLEVSVYTTGLYDSSNNGITSNQNLDLFVEIPDGNISEDYINSCNGKILIVNPFGKNNNHLSFIEDIDDKKWRMFGGNFVWSSDSRFRNLYPAPVPVHDRIEG